MAHMTFGLKAEHCARAIDEDMRCQITNDRMRLMARTPDQITVKVVPQAVFQQPSEHPRQSCAGPSLLELMWTTLIEELSSLMPGGEYHEDQKGDAMLEAVAGDGTEYEKWAEERARVQGACQGIASCIALVLNPYFPNVDDVKAEAITRWTAQEAAAGAGSEEA